MNFSSFQAFEIQQSSIQLLEPFVHIIAELHLSNVMNFVDHIFWRTSGCPRVPKINSVPPPKNW